MGNMNLQDKKILETITNFIGYSLIFFVVGGNFLFILVVFIKFIQWLI